MRWKKVRASQNKWLLFIIQAEGASAWADFSLGVIQGLLSLCFYAIFSSMQS